MHLDDWITPDDFRSFFMDAPKWGKNERKEEANQGIAPTEAEADKNKFQLNLNVSDYKPEELMVKVVDGVFTVRGKHEETKTHKDKQGKVIPGDQEFISTSFRRSFTIPKNVVKQLIDCTLTEDGHLIVSAPLKALKNGSETKPELEGEKGDKATSADSSQCCY
jgi:HSP20 family molecular chaperone IbpA